MSLKYAILGRTTSTLALCALLTTSAFAGDRGASVSPESAGPAQPAPRSRVVGVVPNEILINVEPALAARLAGSAVVSTGDPLLDRVAAAVGAIATTRQFPGAGITDASRGLPDLTGYFAVRFDPARATPEQAAALFAAASGVRSASVIPYHTLRATPNDPGYFNQWYLNQRSDADIDAPEAWNIETGDVSTIVAVPDTGCRWYHADLGGNAVSDTNLASVGGNIWTNEAERSGAPNVDDDSNGFIDDILGYDFVSDGFACAGGEDCALPDNDPRDFDGHGTHCAGIVAAISNNRTGIAAIAGGWSDGQPGAAGNGVRVMPLRIGWATDFGGLVRADFAAQAIVYAAQNGARIISCSWGSSDIPMLADAVDYAIAQNCIILVAAGNDDVDETDYLPSRDDVYAIAATSSDDRRAGFTNFGVWIDLAAPGDNILSTYHFFGDPARDYYARLSGTSMATPLVAGAAAVLWSNRPTATAGEIWGAVARGADDIAALNPGFAGKLGEGRLNARRALADRARPYFSFALDSNPGWSAQSPWAFGTPTGFGGDPNGAYTGANVYGVNLNGAYPSNIGTPRWLTTPALDFRGVVDVEVQFWRWLGVEESIYDTVAIEVSNDGATWTRVWANRPFLIADRQWTWQRVDLSAVADDQATVYVRWGIGPTDDSVTLAGWNLDDVQFWGNCKPPTVVLHPSDTAACNGGTATFEIQATGVRPFTYQWRKDGVDLPGQNGPQLIIADASEADRALYDCVLQDECSESVTLAAALDISTPPSAYNVPFDITLCDGGAEMLWARPDGVGPFTFQWQLNGVDIPDATSNWLHVTDFSAEKAGEYACIVSNACGDSSTTVTTLRTRPLPQITRSPRAVDTVIGATVTLEVEASSAWTYQWRRNGVPLVEAATATLTLRDMKADDAGVYQCRVTNACGQSVLSAPAEVKVRIRTSTWYPDSDKDGYGDRDAPLEAADRPAGYVANNSDCDDACPSCYLAGVEICDGRDNDCDGEIDEGGVCDRAPAPTPTDEAPVTAPPPTDQAGQQTPTPTEDLVATGVCPTASTLLLAAPLLLLSRARRRAA